MARILSFIRKPAAAPSDSAAIAHLLRDFSIEVMPRTAARIEDFRARLPEGTRIYLAHIDGTDFAETIERVHLFPLGGIAATTDYAGAQTARPLRVRA